MKVFNLEMLLAEKKYDIRKPSISFECIFYHAKLIQMLKNKFVLSLRFR